MNRVWTIATTVCLLVGAAACTRAPAEETPPAALPEAAAEAQVAETHPAEHYLPEFGCEPGESKWIPGTNRAECTASWSGTSAGSCSQSSTWNAPPGWVILNTRLSDNSDNNGSMRIDTLAQNSRLISIEEIDDSYSGAIESAGKFLDYEAQAELKERYDSHRRLRLEHQASHNTVVLHVSAKAHGSIFDKKRGWRKATADAQVVCIGQLAVPEGAGAPPAI